MASASRINHNVGLLYSVKPWAALARLGRGIVNRDELFRQQETECPAEVDLQGSLGRLGGRGDIITTSLAA